MNGLECVAYLFALKICSPSKLFLLRGNHETRDVNGWEDHYGDRSFLRQCKARFGRELGKPVSRVVWWDVDRVGCQFGCVVPSPPTTNPNPQTPTPPKNTTGEQVWEAVNQVFDRLPLAAVIDHDIFCVHGGLPRPTKASEAATKVEDLLAVPRVAGISPVYDHESRVSQQVGVTGRAVGCVVDRSVGRSGIHRTAINV